MQGCFGNTYSEAAQKWVDGMPVESESQSQFILKKEEIAGPEKHAKRDVLLRLVSRAL
jgi:hypothetical protein